MLGLTNTLKKTAEGYPQYRTRNSVTLDGNNGYIKVDGSSDFQLNAVDFSISGWIKFTADASGVNNQDGTIIFQATQTPEGGDTNGVIIKYIDESGDDERIYVYHYFGSSSVSINAGSDVDWDHGEWYNITYTYDYSESIGKLYNNGTLIKTRTSATTPDNIESDRDVFVGMSDDETDIITCEVGLWKGTCLSAAQVTALYNNGRPRNLLSIERDTLKGYWRFNAKDDTGTNNVIDYSGEANHGTTGSEVASGDFDTTDVPT